MRVTPPLYPNQSVFSQRYQTDTCVIPWEINRMNKSLQKNPKKNKWICRFFFWDPYQKCDYRNSFNINLCLNPCSRSWFWHFICQHARLLGTFTALTRQFSLIRFTETSENTSIMKLPWKVQSGKLFFCKLGHLLPHPILSLTPLSLLQSSVVSCSACPLHLCRHLSFIISSASSASAESSATAGVWTLWGD